MIFDGKGWCLGLSSGKTLYEKITHFVFILSQHIHLWIQKWTTYNFKKIEKWNVIGWTVFYHGFFFFLPKVTLTFFCMCIHLCVCTNLFSVSVPVTLLFLISLFWRATVASAGPILLWRTAHLPKQCDRAITVFSSPSWLPPPLQWLWRDTGQPSSLSPAHSGRFGVEPSLPLEDLALPLKF